MLASKAIGEMDKDEGGREARGDPYHLPNLPIMEPKKRGLGRNTPCLQD